MFKWRIYYGDGTTFDDTMGKPQDAPSYNVQCVVSIYPGMDDPDIIREVGRLVVHNWQYYLFSEDVGWYGCFTDFDLMDHFISRGHLIQTVKKARTIPYGLYQDIFRKAVNDSDFPVKTAWLDRVEAPAQNGIFDVSVIRQGEADA